KGIRKPKGSLIRTEKAAAMRDGVRTFNPWRSTRNRLTDFSREAQLLDNTRGLNDLARLAATAAADVPPDGPDPRNLVSTFRPPRTNAARTAGPCEFHHPSVAVRSFRRVRRRVDGASNQINARRRGCARTARPETRRHSGGRRARG